MTWIFNFCLEILRVLKFILYVTYHTFKKKIYEKSLLYMYSILTLYNITKYYVKVSFIEFIVLNKF